MSKVPRKTHTLKVWPEHYSAVFNFQKRFEVRSCTDRDFRPGDLLELKEWDPETKGYTGEEQVKHVDYVLKGPGFGIEDGYCVMSLS